MSCVKIRPIRSNHTNTFYNIHFFLESLRQEEMLKAAKKLSSLSEKDLDTVEKVTKGIVAKLIHGPMSHLRQQQEGDATRAAIRQVQQAFQLEEH